MSDRMTILNKIYGLKEDIQELQVLECKRLTEINNLRAENAALRAKLAAEEYGKALRDKAIYGTGIMKDGKHIPAQEYFGTRPLPQPPEVK